MQRFEHYFRRTTRILLCLGLLGFAAAIYIPSQMAARFDGESVCQSLPGCQSLAIEPIYLPEPARLVWEIHAVANRRLDRAQLHAAVLAQVKASWLFSAISEEVRVPEPKTP